ncbi:MAG: hypothetical protein ACI9C1_000885 [Candidatus Aldehydirespiratoraceae bacterium]|jgi:uncharacterized protein (DUF1501 family)
MTTSHPSSSRRTVLKGMAASAGIGAVASVASGPASIALPRLATPAAAAAPPGRVVVVFLRGGIDGLSACVPYNEAEYYNRRPGISISPGAVTDLDGQFGLHPAMAPLHDLYTQGRFAIVEAVGNPSANRSHFEAAAYWEQGTTGNSPSGFGWLARHLLSSTGLPGAEFRAVGLGSNSVRSLGGYTDALVMSSLERFSLGGVGGFGGLYRDQLEMLYYGQGPGEVTGTNALGAVDQIAGLVAANPGSGTYDDTAATLEDARVLLGAGLGVEVITVDIGHWDTHSAMGTETAGRMYDLLDDLATNLVNFQAGLDADGHSDVTTVIMSEFGRRVRENGSGGCDHGWGNIMMAMGGGIAGNQVLGSWPGLAPGALVSGDLAITTDYRDVLAEIVRDRLGNTDLASVFPGHTVTPVGLTL